jgi:MFS family permease
VILILGIVAAQFLRRDPTEMGLVPYGKNEGEEQKSASRTEGISLKEALYTSQLWIAAAVFFCVGYNIWAISIHLVPHITDLGISAVTAANVLAISGGIQAVGGLLLGGAADRIGGRWATVISFILMAASVFYLAPITEVWMFYLFVVVFGLGVGGGGAMLSIVVAELFGVKAHGFILGVIACCFTIGGAVGAFWTGYLFDVNGSYLLAFLICGAIGVVGIILALTLKPIKKPGAIQPEL